jgi:hypothetical protein
LLGRHRRIRDSPPLLVETAEQLVDHPVGGNLAVTDAVGETGQHPFIEIGAFALGHEHVGVIG